MEPANSTGRNATAAGDGGDGHCQRVVVGALGRDLGTVGAGTGFFERLVAAELRDAVANAEAKQGQEAEIGADRQAGAGDQQRHDSSGECSGQRARRSRKARRHEPKIAWSRRRMPIAAAIR